MKKPKNFILAASLNWIAIIADVTAIVVVYLKFSIRNYNEVMKIITAEELNERMKKGEVLNLLDVRDSFEANISDFKIETISIPYDTLRDHLDGLDKESEYIVYCRSGNTSKKASRILRENGFKNVKNLEGGMNGWAKKFDPSLPQY